MGHARPHYPLSHAACSLPTTLCGREWECLPWRGPTGWPRDRKTGRTRSWRASNSSTVQTRPTARTCSRLPVRLHRLRKWSTPGRRNLGTTTTFRTDAAVCAGTTRKSSGVTRKKWDAQWREGEDARSGSATTIRQATGSAGGPIEAVMALQSTWRLTHPSPTATRSARASHLPISQKTQTALTWLASFLSWLHAGHFTDEANIDADPEMVKGESTERLSEVGDEAGCAAGSRRSTAAGQGTPALRARPLVRGLAQGRRALAKECQET